MADDEELLGGLFGGGGQPAWMNALSALSSIPTRRERLMGRGGYTPAMPSQNNTAQQAAMLRQWQQQNEVEDLTRIQDALAGSLEATGGEYGDEAITGYLTLRGTQPWRSPIGAQKGLEVVSKLREKGIAQREERTRAGIYDEVLEGNPNANPMELLRGMVQRGAAKGVDVSADAVKIAQLRQRGLHVFNDGGILTFVDEYNRKQPVTQHGAKIFVGEGLPPYAIRPDANEPSGFGAQEIGGAPWKAGDRPVMAVPRAQQLGGPPEETATQGEMPEQLGGPPEDVPPSLRQAGAPVTPTMTAGGPAAPVSGPGGYETRYAGQGPQIPPGMKPTKATIGGVTYETEGAKPPKLSQAVLDILEGQEPPGPVGSPEYRAWVEKARVQANREATAKRHADQQQLIELRREGRADDYLMKDAEKFIDTATGNYLPPLTTARQAEGLMKAGKAVSVPFEFDRQVIRQSRGIWGKLDRLEEIIQRRNDFFPDVDADAFPQALAKIGVARAKAWASGQIDADAAWIQKSLAPLGASLNRFSGDSGNVAIQERISNLASIGGTPMAKKAALALSGELRQAIRENLTQYGLNPEEFLGTKTQQGGTAAPKAPREGYKWVRNPQGIRGQWPANEPLAPGYTDLK